MSSPTRDGSCPRFWQAGLRVHGPHFRGVYGETIVGTACLLPHPPIIALFEGKAIAVKIRCGDKSLSLLQILVWSSHFLELSHYQNIRCVLGCPRMSSEGSPCSQEEEGHEDGQNIHKVHLQWDLAGTSLTWGGSHGSRVNCGSLRVTLPSRSYARCRWIRLGGQKEAQAAL